MVANNAPPDLAANETAIVATHLSALARDVDMMVERGGSPDHVALTQVIAHERATCINVALGLAGDDPTGFQIVAAWFAARTEVDKLVEVCRG